MHKQQKTPAGPENNDTQRTPFAPKQPKLTRRQAIFVKEYIDNGGNGTQAALKAYSIGTKHGSSNPQKTAAVIASENLTKPEIQSSLASHSDMIESTLVNTVKEWGDSDNSRRREIALDAAKYVHDKVHGKATQRIQATTEAVTINIDLTGQV